MPPGRYYFPVGREYSAAYLRQFSTEQLQQRELLDPQFGAFDFQFNWRDYVDLNTDDPVWRARLEQCLEQFSQTVDGQHILRQAAAMQQHRFNGMDEATQQHHPEMARVRIALGTRGFFLTTGQILISPQELAAYPIPDATGTLFTPSLQHMLIHELAHAADPLMPHGAPIPVRAVANARADARYNPLIAAAEGSFFADPSVVRALNIAKVEEANSYIEYPSMAFTTRFMGIHYGEAQRNRYIIDAPSPDTPRRIDPDLEFDMTYDALRNNPVGRPNITPRER